MVEQGFDELGKLGSALDNPAFRRAFSEDAQAAMTDNGIVASQIPQSLVDALAELTPAELRVLSDIKDALQQIGDLPPEIINTIV